LAIGNRQSAIIGSSPTFQFFAAFR
jgi:hypothetical protein